MKFHDIDNSDSDTRYLLTTISVKEKACMQRVYFTLDDLMREVKKHENKKHILVYANVIRLNKIQFLEI